MNTKSSPSRYRYWKSRRSTFSMSIFAPALYVLSTTLPVTTFLSLVRTNAPPLPGLTCWNSTTFQSCPSMLSTTPLRMSAVEAMGGPIREAEGAPSVRNAPRSVVDGAPTGADRSGLGGGAGEDRGEREPVRVEPQPRDHSCRDAGHDARVPELLPRMRVREVHLDERQAGFRDDGDSVPQGVGVVREGGRIEDDGHPFVD